MKFELPKLPFEKNALAPHISEETIEYHYGKHHQAYVNKLNSLLEDKDEYSHASLEEVILKSKEGPIFNNAAQVWNHSFYWNCLTPNYQNPSEKLVSLLKDRFGGLEEFKKEFSDRATNNFGSGWTWLVQDKLGKLQIVNTSNAGTPLLEGLRPLLTIDVWEHAYYVDHRNARPTYIDTFWKLVNWDFVEKQLA